MNNHPATTPARWWDLTAALILLAMMLTAALRLAATHWTEYLPLVQTITVLEVIAGLALAQSRFSSSTVVIFAFIYGIFFISWQLGLTVGEGIDWPERMLRVGQRLLITIEDLIEQQPVSDNLFFLLLMSILFWTVTVFGAYNLVRHAQAWQAILPAGLALMVIHIYALLLFGAYLVPGGIYIFRIAAPGACEFPSTTQPLETKRNVYTAVRRVRFHSGGVSRHRGRGAARLDDSGASLFTRPCRKGLAEGIQTLVRACATGSAMHFHPCKLRWVLSMTFTAIH